jgi:F0F1-type ATP synthase membrane subunit b/b'
VVCRAVDSLKRTSGTQANSRRTASLTDAAVRVRRERRKNMKTQQEQVQAKVDQLLNSIGLDTFKNTRVEVEDNEATVNIAVSIADVKDFLK